MPSLTEILSFDWIEGNRLFSIVFGTIMSGSCFAVAVPTLWWFLPRQRIWIFPQELDPKRRWQFWFGMFGMGMAFTNALCRYIPHGDLGIVHPVFFLTTIAYVLFLGTRVAAVALGRPRMRVSRTALATSLALFVAIPVSAVAYAFGL